MKFECPSCKTSGQIDDSTVPEDGVYANCLNCKTKFIIKKHRNDFVFEPVSLETKQDAPSPVTFKRALVAMHDSNKIQYKRINPHIYSVSMCGGLSCILFSFSAIKEPFASSVLMFIGGIGMVVGSIYGLIGLGRCWAVLQGTTARTTPNKAVGFLFIPIYNFYWIFIAHAGLATDANKFAEQERLSNKINYNLAVVACIVFIIPYLNIVSYILFTILMYQMAALNNEILDKWDQLSKHPRESFCNRVGLIVAIVFVGIALIGMLAAIAIPQLGAYNKRKALHSAESKSDWQVSNTNDICNYYIDYNSIKKYTYNTIIFNGKYSYFDNRPEIKELYEVNCNKMQTRVLESLEGYDGNWTAIQPISTDWLTEQPGLPMYRTVEAVCVNAILNGLL